MRLDNLTPKGDFPETLHLSSVLYSQHQVVSIKFHIDVTFGMRTVLYRIHLFNDKI
jgi:hypothetical protein